MNSDAGFPPSGPSACGVGVALDRLATAASTTNSTASAAAGRAVAPLSDHQRQLRPHPPRRGQYSCTALPADTRAGRPPSEQAHRVELGPVGVAPGGGGVGQQCQVVASSSTGWPPTSRPAACATSASQDPSGAARTGAAAAQPVPSSRDRLWEIGGVTTMHSSAARTADRRRRSAHRHRGRPPFREPTLLPADRFHDDATLQRDQTTYECRGRGAARPSRRATSRAGARPRPSGPGSGRTIGSSACSGRGRRGGEWDDVHGGDLGAVHAERARCARQAVGSANGSRALTVTDAPVRTTRRASSPGAKDTPDHDAVARAREMGNAATESDQRGRLDRRPVRGRSPARPASWSTTHGRVGSISANLGGCRTRKAPQARPAAVAAAGGSALIVDS